MDLSHRQNFTKAAHSPILYTINSRVIKDKNVKKIFLRPIEKNTEEYISVLGYRKHYLTEDRKKDQRERNNSF